MPNSNKIEFQKVDEYCLARRVNSVQDAGPIAVAALIKINQGNNIFESIKILHRAHNYADSHQGEKMDGYVLTKILVQSLRSKEMLANLLMVISFMDFCTIKKGILSEIKCDEGLMGKMMELVIEGNYYAYELAATMKCLDQRNHSIINGLDRFRYNVKTEIGKRKEYVQFNIPGHDEFIGNIARFMDDKSLNPIPESDSKEVQRKLETVTKTSPSTIETDFDNKNLIVKYMVGVNDTALLDQILAKIERKMVYIAPSATDEDKMDIIIAFCNYKNGLSISENLDKQQTNSSGRLYYGNQTMYPRPQKNHADKNQNDIDKLKEAIAKKDSSTMRQLLSSNPDLFDHISFEDNVPTSEACSSK